MTSDFSPRVPHRPLAWPDVVFDVQDILSGVEQPVYIVGGAVRDALMHRPVKDLDLATPGSGTSLARRIANALNGDFFVLDAERDVGRAIVETMHGAVEVDVARFRNEPSSLLADLQDRDFTMNAMAADMQGDLSLLIDPLNGEQDVQNKVVRRTGPDAISSDPVRSLRAVRQSTQLKFRIEPDTLRDVRAAALLLHQSSAERIRDELMTTLSLNRSFSALRVLAMLGLLDVVFPVREAYTDAHAWDRALKSVEKLRGLYRSMNPSQLFDEVAPDFGYGIAAMQLNPYRKNLGDYFRTEWPNQRKHIGLLVLAILLLETSPADAAAAADQLRLSNAEKKRLLAVVKSKDAVLNLMDTTALSLHRYWYQLEEAGIDVALLTLATYLGQAGVYLEQQDWLRVVDRVRVVLDAYFLQYDTVVAPPALVSGADLMEGLNLQPGPVIGRLLDAIREAQVQGDVLTRQDALALASTVLDNDSR